MQIINIVHMISIVRMIFTISEICNSSKILTIRWSKATSSGRQRNRTTSRVPHSNFPESKKQRGKGWYIFRQNSDFAVKGYPSSPRNRLQTSQLKRVKSLNPSFDGKVLHAIWRLSVPKQRPKSGRYQYYPKDWYDIIGTYRMFNKYHTNR